MNYIYDIVLNFQDNYYDFFEWNREDKIKNILKIPLYRVTDEDIKILKNNKIKVDKKLIDKIKIDNKNYKKIICLVSNGKLSLGLLFNEEGYLLKRSSLIFEEEEETNLVSEKLPITHIKYIKNVTIKPKNKLRIEKEKKSQIIKYLKETKDISKLKYVYYEYYKKECTQKDLIIKTLIRELNQQWTPKQKKLYKLIKFLGITKEKS